MFRQNLPQIVRNLERTIAELCRKAAKKLVESELLMNGAIVVLESGEEEIDVTSLNSFEVIKSTHYGKKSFVNILL